MFYGNTNMTAITIGSNITSIGASAFQNCTTLPSITIPSSVTTIGASTFQGCTALTSIILPTTSITITSNSNAFTGIAQVVSVNGSAGNTSLPANMFYGNTNMTAITIGSNITSIETSAFQSCTALTNINIPSTVTSIGASAFQSCTALTKVYVQSNTLVSMGTTVFTGIPSNSMLFTTSINLDNTSLTQYFTNKYLIQLTNYLVKNPNTGEDQDLFYLFCPGNSGIITGYKTPTGYEVGSIFLPLYGGTQLNPYGGTQLNFTTKYKKNGADFNTLFSSTLPQFIISNNNTYTSINFVITNSYNAVIFEYTGGVYTWNGLEPFSGNCDITFNTSVNLNYLIIGGGGGGGRGDYGSSSEYSAGTGGSGGGIIYNNTTPLTIPLYTTFNIQVGFNGGGNSNTSGSGTYAGRKGGTSYIKSTQYDISFNAFGGEPGASIGIPYNGQSGNGGNAKIYSTLSPEIYHNFGGGGGAGGAAFYGNNDKQGGSYNAGYGGYLNTTSNQGQNGSNGPNPTPPRSAGNGFGGSSYYNQTITVPFKNGNSGNTSYVYAGNGGGGGNYNRGGNAGGISGGSNSYNSYNGESAISGFYNNNFYYGSGGGGSTIFLDSRKGGDGGKGVVMLWWSV